MKAQTLTIIGLDRLGASVGLAVRAAETGLTVIGHDRDRAKGQRAKEIGAIDETNWNLVKASAAADILVLAVSLVDLKETLKAIGQDVQAHALVLDLSSMKGPGLEYAAEFLKHGHYVGASPILAADALTEARQGIDAARADLFRSSVFCVTPSPSADPKAVETAVNFGHMLGATPYFLDALEYDSLVQGVETAPGLVAAAMFQAVRQATGWRDILRFSGLPFALSTLAMDDVDLPHRALRDRDASLRWLDSVIEELQNVRRWVAEGDEERMNLLMENLGVERARWLHERRENNWSEQVMPEDIKDLSLGGQMLGFGLRGKKSDS